MGSFLSDEVRSAEAGPSTDWAACLAVDEGTQGAGTFFLALYQVGRLLPDELPVGSVEAGSSVGWAGWAFSATFLAARAALASASCFFFARSPMVDNVDKKQETKFRVMNPRKYY